jgi:hypothetical protein
MTLTAKFERQQFGAMVAQILESYHSVVEVSARNDGKFNLIVHCRTGEPDRWTDISATLESKHFQMLGSIANQQPLSEKPSDISDIFGPMETDLIRYRNAILWAIDRLTSDDLTQKEIKKTADELGKTILGKPSQASTYVPNDWDSSAKLPVRGA